MIFDKEEIIETLKALVEIKSNYFHEEEIMDYVFNRLRAKGLDAQMHTYHDEKVTRFKGKNVIGRFGNPDRGPVILLNAHLDTVNVGESWTYDPLSLTLEGDRAYGLGACDMKSGAAAMILAIEKLHDMRENLNGELLYSFVSDEEGPYGLGTNYLIHDGLLDDADLAIVTEPSSAFGGIAFPNVCLGARGGTSYQINFYGKSAHGAHPHLGISAIRDAAKVVTAIGELVLPDDGVLGTGANCIIAINGGGDACSVAERASVEVFRHMVTGETEETVRDEIEKTIDKLELKSQYEIVFRRGPTEGADLFMPYVSDQNNPLVVKFNETIKHVTGAEPTRSYFDSIGDFNYLGSRLNIPVIVFGPEGGNFHGSDEWVDVPSAHMVTEVVYRYLHKVL